MVLSNSLDTTDASDWIDQLLVENIIGKTDSHDFVDITRRTRDIHLTHYPQLKQKMDEQQLSKSSMKSFQAYADRYQNSLGTFVIDVAVSGDELRMWCQGYESMDYNLYHYSHDIFAWEAIKDNDIKKVIFSKWYEGFHIVKFLFNQDGHIDALS